MGAEPDGRPVPSSTVIINPDQRDQHPAALNISHTPEVPLHPNAVCDERIPIWKIGACCTEGANQVGTAADFAWRLHSVRDYGYQRVKLRLLSGGRVLLA